MADFSTAYSITAKVEGGYANNPKDTGGETWKGIARNHNPNWKGWNIIDSYKSKPNFPDNLKGDGNLQQHVLSLYKSNYWDVLHLDELQDQKVANELYDTCVNMGTGVAATFLQRVLNVVNRGEALYPNLTVDGAIGARSISAFNSLDTQGKFMVYKLLNCLQGSKYISICESNPSQEIFMRSWCSRVFE